ncbi:MAG: acyl-CoA thioesterase [Pseudomarimonas sp.]
MSHVVIAVDVEVRWSDMDAFGHVNNARFLSFVEEARIQWMQSLPEPWDTPAIAPLLAAVEMNFRRPIGWPETVRIELVTRRVGNSSVTMAHRIVSVSDPECLYADGQSVMVWIDRPSGRPTALPGFVRTAAAVV